MEPLTGWFRDGCCDTDARDRGLHTVCAILTADFLAFSESVGNDLSTPRPEYGFPGLSAGDQWCLCAGRWEEARLAGHAPKVKLGATHSATLAVVSLEHLQAYSA